MQTPSLALADSLFESEELQTCAHDFHPELVCGNLRLGAGVTSQAKENENSLLPVAQCLESNQAEAMTDALLPRLLLEAEFGLCSVTER